MRMASLILLVACTSKEPAPVDPTETADSDEAIDTEVVDTDTPGVDSDSGPPVDTGPTIIDFEQGSYRATSIRVMPPGDGIDQDGDGDIDNALPELLLLVDAALPGDLSPTDVNDRLLGLILTQELNILFDANHDGTVLTIDVLEGELDTNGDLRATPGSFDELGMPRQHLVGAFVVDNDIRVGPGSITVPIQFLADEPVVRFEAATAYLRGQLDDDDFGAFMSGAFTVSSIMDDVVIPLIDSFVIDPTDRAGLVALAQTIIDGEADVVVNGEPAISTTFRIEAEPATWLPPL